jgi:hypothetical protein
MIPFDPSDASMTPMSTRTATPCRPPFRLRAAGLLLGACALVLVPAGANALTITLDFSYDAAANGGTGFFETTPLAQAAVVKAAADISSAILPSLGAVSTDSFMRSSGGANATFDWEINITNPSTGADITFPTFSLAQDALTIYVGMQRLTGSTLGQGGPGGAGVQVSGGGNPAGFPAAVASAQNASNAVMPREGGGNNGPIIGTLSGNIGGTNYSVSYGPLAGNLWFDIDTNNNGVQDTVTQLANFWSYDANAPVTAGKSDFYSVALHEILHSLGFGASDSWDSMRSGTTWSGANAIALNGGSGLNLVTGDGHIREGFMSATLFGGTTQEAVMDPTITVGTRKLLTQADAAFLRDIGYVVIPEPTSLAMFGLGLLVFAARKRRTNCPPREARQTSKS